MTMNANDASQHKSTSAIVAGHHNLTQLALTEHPGPSIERLIRIDDVKAKTGLSRSYIYELAAKGLFPASISLIPGGTSKAWVASEIDAWIQSRINASRSIH